MFNLLTGRRTCSCLCLMITALVMLFAGCESSLRGTPQGVVRIVTPTLSPITPTPTFELISTATSTAAVLPSPTVTPWPTLNPSVLQATADAGLAQAMAASGEAEIVCLRHEDLDADGAPEWLALTYQVSDGSGRLGAFVIDETRSYILDPTPSEPGRPDFGFGSAPTCELVLRDINIDGSLEIAIFGHGEGNKTLMHLFAWDGSAYRRLGFFGGDAGVKFVDRDGDLEEEIWEGYRVGDAPNLVWYVVHTWENGTYGWTSEHYDWYYADRPQTYPSHSPETAVIAFYLALDDRDLPGAWALLSSDMRPDYAAWVMGYATTLQVSVGSVHSIPGTVGEDRARVAAMVTAWDNEGGVIVARIWNVEWDTVRTSSGWRLVDSSTELLTEWVVSFWPE